MNVDPSVLRERVEVQVIELFCNVPDSTENDQVVTKDICSVPTPLNRRFSIGLKLGPTLVCDVVDPDVVQFFGAIILTSEHIHVSLVNRS